MNDADHKYAPRMYIVDTYEMEKEIFFRNEKIPIAIDSSDISPCLDSRVRASTTI